MAAIVLTPTGFAEQLQEAGMPPAQAKVVAEGLAAMYVQHFDALVTKDYLNTRFDEFESRIGRELDHRFAQVDARFADIEARFDARFAEVDHRFAAQDARFELRFNELESRMQLGFAEMETRFAKVNVMLAVILAALAVPVLQTVLVWVA